MKTVSEANRPLLRTTVVLRSYYCWESPRTVEVSSPIQV